MIAIASSEQDDGSAARMSRHGCRVSFLNAVQRFGTQNESFCFGAVAMKRREDYSLNQGLISRYVTVFRNIDIS